MLGGSKSYAEKYTGKEEETRGEAATLRQSQKALPKT